MRSTRDAMYDVALLLKDAGLVAASGAAQVASSARQLDLGGVGRVDGRVLATFTAIEIDTGNEGYTVQIQFSNTWGFGAGVVNGPALRVGHSSVTLASASDVASKRELPFSNQVDGVNYRYMRLYTIVVGTIVTGVNFTAFAELAV